MTGPAHSVETSYEPHRNLITGVVNRSRLAAEVGSRTSGVGGDEGAPGAVAGLPAQDADGTVARSATGGAIVSSYVYANDLLGRRETISQGGEAFGMLALGENRVEVAYNDRSEVVGAVTRRGDIPVARHSYAYDAIGNRQRSASEVGTRAAGRRSESESNRKSEVSYEANALNQYAEVKTLSVDSVNSVGRPVHDPDGNLLEDARNTYTWNADNNLVRVEAKDGSLRLDYVYDHQSRRTVRIETSNPGKDNESRRTTYYLYDDWNLLAELESSAGSGASEFGLRVSSFLTWGRDLSGSLQGAGGVGGLLAISQGEEHRYPTYDANGNIGQLIDGAGSIVAAYAYDPFGNVTEMAGAEAAENPWRFSTKPVEAGTGWFYYGYRWYDAGMGRWVNRDPIEESGGVNLYGFVGNDGVVNYDKLGQSPFAPHTLPLIPTALIAWLSLPPSCRYAITAAVESWRNPDLSKTDKFRHCLGHCEVEKECPIGFSEIAGILVELTDLLPNQPGWDEEDILANQFGQNCASSGECHCCCQNVDGIF